MQSAFIITYSLVCPVVGWIGDRSSRMRLAAAGVFVWSAATVASGLAPTYPALLLARAVVGVGEASYAVVTPSLLSDCYPADRRARVLGIFYAAIPVGTALGYIVGGFVGERHGWRYAFFIAGAPGLALALLLLAIREPVRGAYDPPGAQTSAPAGAGRFAPRAAGATQLRLQYPRAGDLHVRDGRAGDLDADVLRARAGDPTRHRGLDLRPPTGDRGLSRYAAGRTARRHFRAARTPGAHFLVSGWTLAASLVFTVPAVLSRSPAVFWPAMFVTLLMLFVNVGPLNAAMANVLPPDLRARGFALTTMVMHLFGDAASPWLIGVASDAVGLTAPVLVAGAMLGLAGVVLLGGRRALERDMHALRSRDQR